MSAMSISNLACLALIRGQNPWIANMKVFRSNPGLDLYTFDGVFSRLKSADFTDIFWPVLTICDRFSDKIFSELT